MIVISMELRQFLIPMQRHVRGVDIEDQFLWRLVLCRDELFKQHAIQGDHIRTRGPRFQTREGRRTRQLVDLAHGRLHQ